MIDGLSHKPDRISHSLRSDIFRNSKDEDRVKVFKILKGLDKLDLHLKFNAGCTGTYISYQLFPNIILCIMCTSISAMVQVQVQYNDNHYTQISIIIICVVVVVLF